MHDDFFRLAELPQRSALVLPTLPVDHHWSADLWVSQRGDWLAFWNPLNLALVYLHGKLLLPAQPESFWRDHLELLQQLKTERMLLDQAATTEADERQDLIRQARQGSFRFICILPTTACSLECLYCHQRVAPGAERTMTIAEIEAGLGKCSELCTDLSKPVDVLLYGGEPLNAFSITERVLQLCQPNGGLFQQPVRVSFTTSGLGLSDERADLLAQHNVFTIISLDGAPECNDPVRRTKRSGSAFAIAERAYQMLKQRGCRVGLSITIGTHNLPDLKLQVEYLLDRFVVNDVGLNAFLHHRNGVANPFQIGSAEAFQALLDGLEVTGKYGVYAEQPFRRFKPFVFRRPLLKDCSAPSERLVLVPGGLLGFCDSCFPERSYYYPISDFPEKDHPDRQLWASLSAPEMPICSQCPAMIVCGGACRFDAFEASGSLNGVDPLRCQFERAFLDWMIWRVWECALPPETDYFFPQAADRQKLFANVRLQAENQPFIAGSYSHTEIC